jgi:hypothetical protein
MDWIFCFDIFGISKRLEKLFQKMEIPLDSFYNNDSMVIDNIFGNGKIDIKYIDMN